MPCVFLAAVCHWKEISSEYPRPMDFFLCLDIGQAAPIRDRWNVPFALWAFRHTWGGLHQRSQPPAAPTSSEALSFVPFYHKPNVPFFSPVFSLMIWHKSLLIPFYHETICQTWAAYAAWVLFCPSRSWIYPLYCVLSCGKKKSFFSLRYFSHFPVMKKRSRKKAIGQFLRAGHLRRVQ